MAYRPGQAPYPLAPIVATGAAAVVNTGASVVLQLPTTINGQRPGTIRVAVTGAAPSIATAAGFVRLSTTASSATVSSSDTLIIPSEALWLNTMGMNAIALMTATNGAVRFQISALEDQPIIPANNPTPGLG